MEPLGQLPGLDAVFSVETTQVVPERTCPAGQVVDAAPFVAEFPHAENRAIEPKLAKIKHTLLK